jgi:hypothetical protein
MSGWIKFEKDVRTDPRFLRMLKAHVTQMRITHALGVTQLAGALVNLWCYADTHIREDDTLDLGPTEIDDLIGIEGFSALMPIDWLEVLDTNRVKLPGFQEHNGTEAKKRALTQKRVARHRIRNVTQERNGSEVGSNVVALPDQTRPDQTRPRKNPSASLTPAWFAEFKSAYPTRSGDQGWRKAERAANARVAEGHVPREMIDGALRYAAYCRASQKTGTEFVKQACTFLGPDKPFLLPWSPPPSKAQVQQDSNITASLAWLEKSNGTV